MVTLLQTLTQNEICMTHYSFLKLRTNFLMQSKHKIFVIRGMQRLSICFCIINQAWWNIFYLFLLLLEQEQEKDLRLRQTRNMSLTFEESRPQKESFKKLIPSGEMLLAYFSLTPQKLQLPTHPTLRQHPCEKRRNTSSPNIAALFQSNTKKHCKTTKRQ